MTGKKTPEISVQISFHHHRQVGGWAYSISACSGLFRCRISQSSTQVGIKPVHIIQTDVNTVGRGGRGAITCLKVDKILHIAYSHV